MRLDYFWISKYRNIQDQQFNLGGNYFYLLKRTNKDSYRLTRVANKQFVSGFFKNEGLGFNNISAIVGENGSGKTNTLDFIRGIISNRFNIYNSDQRFSSGDFIAVFTGTNGEVYVTINSTVIKVEAAFKHNSIKDVPGDVLSIYYSPVYDFRIYPIQSYSDDIDVSGNYLIQEDFEAQKYALDTINQVEIHKYLNSSRQLEFINFIQLDDDFTNRIKIPTSADVLVYYNPSSHGSNEFWNTSWNFREIFKYLDKKHQTEINNLARQKDKQRQNKLSKTLLKIQGEMFFSWALYYLIKNLKANIERTNHFLQEGRVSISINDLDNLNLQDSLVHFIKNQNLFPIKEVLVLIKELEIVKSFVLNYDDGPQDLKKVTVPVNSLSELQSAYLQYVGAMQQIAGSSVPYGFMNFDWHGLSTGEKAYLDLFARVYYAKQKILRSIEDIHAHPRLESFPSNIILFLDEGEIGFHLQWQKEYVKLLVSVIPILFRDNHVTLQLIFTTHSPISLSDIPHSNIIFLGKENGYAKVLSREERPFHSFGANIHDLIHDAFYLRSGFMGDFAEAKIQKAINWCLEPQNREGAEEIQILISLIDEPIIKVKLSEMYAEKMGDNVERARLLAQQVLIQQRLQQLSGNDSN